MLLYELLTGTTPFAGETLARAGYDEMQRIIRETDRRNPRPDCARWAETLSDVAHSRQSSPELLPKLVKGDLDWIVMKALEKDRTHRYETANALAEDIERHLRHEPILAGSPSAAYRVREVRAPPPGRRSSPRPPPWWSWPDCCWPESRTLGSTSSRPAPVTRDCSYSSRTCCPAVSIRKPCAEIKPILPSRYVGSKARLLHARVVLELQGPHAGVELLQALLKERPEVAASAHFLLARIYLQGDPNDPEIKGKAETHLEQGQRLMPQTAEAYLLQAMTVPTVREILRCLNDALAPRSHSLRGAPYGAAWPTTPSATTTRWKPRLR